MDDEAEQGAIGSGGASHDRHQEGIGMIEVEHETDVKIERYGTRPFLRPITPAGRRWMEENLPPEWAEGGVKVDRHDLEVIIEWMTDDGLSVQ
jgi:hypothetical protein